MATKFSEKENLRALKEKLSFKGELKDKSVFKPTQHSHELNREVSRTGRVFFFFHRLPTPQNFLPRWSFSSERKKVERKFRNLSRLQTHCFIFLMLRTIFTFLRERISIRMKGPRHENVLVRVEKKILRRFLFSAANAVSNFFNQNLNIPTIQSIPTLSSLQLS